MRLHTQAQAANVSRKYDACRHEHALTLAASVLAGDQCTGYQGERMPCCVWQPAPWAPLYKPLAGVAGLWTALLLFEIKVREAHMMQGVHE